MLSVRMLRGLPCLSLVPSYVDPVNVVTVGTRPIMCSGVGGKRLSAK